MKVLVRMFTTLRELAGKGEEILQFGADTVTVGDVLSELANNYGKEFRECLYDDRGRVQEHLQLLVNGKSVSLLEQLETRLRAGDQVAIVPPVGGG